MIRPTISVVIPAYRAEATIAHALRSVYAQSVPPDEVIVVDDGSPDETARFVEEHFPMVRLIRQENQGCGMARNTGAAAASGDWLAFLDADDWWLPNKIERQLRETADTKVAIVASRARGQTGRTYQLTPSFDELWEENQLGVSSALVRRSAFEQAKGFWSRRACEDYHLWLRLTAMGWKVVNCPEELIAYEPTPMSLSRQFEGFMEAERACIEDVAMQYGLPRERTRRRVAQAYRNHARGALHFRDMRAARRFLRRSLRYSITMQQVFELTVASAPRFLFDLRRRLLAPGT
jgi:cellulose synthase/poly-beta-1,6-N-acetylglucosamine synthase-like glycosyltransferase